MEYGELVYISRDLINCGEHKSPEDCRAEHNRVIVHEIAHQWWYGLVGNNQTSNAWIDEGLAEYSTLLFYDNNPEYNINRKEVIDNARQNYSAFVKIIKGIGGELNTNMSRDLNNFNSSYEYVFMTYIKGLLLFCDLETILTKSALTQALGEFAESTKFSIATPTKLVQSLERTTNTKLGLFFECYLSGFAEN
jgi:aminopeptidase N